MNTFWQSKGQTMWSETIERYLREGRAVSGGCGPSKAMKAINTSIQDFAGKVKDEAGSVFAASSSVFHNIMGAVTGIVTGGPSQYGNSSGEQAAKVAAATQAGATEARNLKGAAAAGVGAIGGGNVVNPAGLQQQTVMAADQKAASDTASSMNDITQQGYAKGYNEWQTALKAEQQAPDVFNASTQANQGVTTSQHEAATSQQNIDTQSNWAMNDIMKLGETAVSAWSSGGFKLPGGGKSSTGGGGGRSQSQDSAFS